MNFARIQDYLIGIELMYMIHSFPFKVLSHDTQMNSPKYANNQFYSFFINHTVRTA